MASPKYRNSKIKLQGIVFHSKKEGGRYLALQDKLRRGEISDLELQPKFTVTINGKKICNYFADFRYVENGKIIVEDVKGFKTEVYKLKKKMVEAQYDIVIQEI